MVVNKYRASFDVYIGRGSVWGNPYSHKTGTMAQYMAKDRDESIALYRKHLFNELQTGVKTKADLIALEGKILGCFCKPKACHGDVIMEAIKWAVK
jgi:hypothetical protein